MEKLAKRIRSSNKQYFDAGVDAGTQKACDLLLVAAYECGFIRTPGTTFTTYYNAGPSCKAVFANHIQSDIVMDIIKGNAEKIKEILDGDGDEELQ